MQWDGVRVQKPAQFSYTSYTPRRLQPVSAARVYLAVHEAGNCHYCWAQLHRPCNYGTNISVAYIIIYISAKKKIVKQYSFFVLIPC